VGLKSDGTVVAVGNNPTGVGCNVTGWTDIVQVAAGSSGYTVGLKSDGTVVAVGSNDYGQCNVGNWTNITQVAAGVMHTVGLKLDGTVVAVGWNGLRQCNVSDWTNIIQIAAGWYHTVGVKADGTVVAVGDNSYGECQVGGWTNITEVAAGIMHTVGLKLDGTVVAAGAEVELPTWNLTVIEYTLAISSTAGGSATTPGVGNFTYDEGTVVDLVATPDAGYRFVNWTGDVSTIANVTAAATSIIMNSDYSLKANFEQVPSDGWCFIATAAYGTPLVKEIQILRGFRDEYLLTNPPGRAFVQFYYRVSPPIAEFITERPGLKPIVRVGLVPAVAMSAIAVNTTPAQKMAILGLLALVSVALAVWVTRRRSRGPQYT
jgi:alpha-tubulin suppressor-like RCC1 family protein